MELIGVTYSPSLQEYDAWGRLAQDLHLDSWVLLDTGSDAHLGGRDNVQRINNDYFEFGAYHEALQHVRSDGPYLLVNNTVFRTRSVFLWKQVLRGIPTTDLAPFYGDGTPRPRPHLADIPDPYYSSWIFLIRDKEALRVFTDAIAQSLPQCLEERTDSYRAYVNAWLQPKNRLSGWHGPKSKEHLARKEKTIVWEHALSTELVKHGICTFSEVSPWHRWAQVSDKILRHWASFVKY